MMSDTSSFGGHNPSLTVSSSLIQINQSLRLLLALLVVVGAIDARANECVDDFAVRPKTGEIQLSWADELGTNQYDVLRANAFNGPHEQIATTQPTFFTTYLDESVDNGVAYYYKIRRVPGDNGETFCFSHLLAAVAPTRSQRITTVPNIRNRSQEAAAITLGKSKLSVGTVGKRNSDTIASSNVIDQNPPPNSVVPQNYGVDFNVSLGADTPTNSPPTITSTPVTLATEGLLYSYEVGSEDADTGDTITYSLEAPPKGMSIDPPTGLIQWTPTDAQLGDHPVTIRVEDNGGLFDTQRFTITVAHVNESPIFTSSTVTRATEGQLYSYDVDAEDPDTGDTLTYSLEAAPSGMSIDSASGLIQWTPTNAQGGDHPVTVRVEDTGGLFDTQSFTVTVANLNGPPTITSSPVTEAKEGQLYSYDVNAQDPDTGDTLTYSLEAAPTGMNIDSATGLIQWTPTNAQGGDHPVTVRVEDNGGLFDTQGFTMAVDNANQAPAITSSSVTQATQGQPYSYDVDAEDPDTGDTLTYSLTAAPTGMNINPSSGLIQWTPADAQGGDHPVTVRVEDNGGLFDTQGFTVAVDNANKAPAITSSPVTQAKEGQLYSYDVDAKDPDPKDTLTYSLKTAPTGMNINPSSGLIQWTPTNAQGGDHPVTVRVEDNGGLFDTQSLKVAVDNANKAPTITSSPVTQATEEKGYSYDVDAEDPDPKDTLTYSLNNAPTGMRINPATGLIQWTPTDAQGGDHPVTVRVEDNGGLFDTQGFTVAVNNANKAPTITSSPVTRATEGKRYSYDVDAEDPDPKDSLTYSLTNEPTGMRINPATGLIQWTPTNSQVGDHPIRVRVQDSRGSSVTQRFTISVSSSPALVAVPDVVDLSQAEAEAAVIDVGLSVGNVTTANSDTVTAGNVIRQNPAGGKKVSSGSGVNLVISEGVSGDVTPPTVEIIAPPTDSEVSAPVEIVGTATDTNLADYTLRLSPAGKNDYTDIASGNAPVANGTLGTLDPTELTNGLYDLLLVARDVNGQTSSAKATYQVTGDLKVGNFSFSVEDLSIPVSGIPITVNRTYDTRRKHEKLDFGYGWSIDYQNIKVEENRIPGTDWEQTNTGGTSPTYCIEPVSVHYIAVTLPDGQTEEFDVSVSPRCRQLVPLDSVVPVFTARPDTFSTLTSPTPLDLRYTSGKLIDQATGQPYDPSQYTLTTVEGYVYELDQNFGIRRITDPNGNHLEYSSTGIVHSSGKSVNFNRNAEGRISDITDPNGYIVTYDYDANGDLIAVIDQEGNFTEHLYNSAHALTDYIDPRGITPAKNIYDESGRLVAHVDAEGNRIEYSHDVGGRQEIITDRRANETVYTYDNNGNVLTQTDALGNTSTFTYDARDNPLTETDPLGNTTSRTYDARDNLLTETDPPGNVTTYTYNARNQVLTMTDRLGNTTSYDYDANGNLISITDPQGNVTTNTYDALGNLLSTTDPLGQTTTHQYDEFGNRTQETDPLGNVKTYTFDANGNELTATTSRTDPGGSTVTVVTSREYDGSNRIIQQIDALGSVSATEYNSIGKLAAEIDKNDQRTEFEYDARGNLARTIYTDSKEETNSYDEQGNKIGSTDRAGNTTSFEYDDLNRLVRTVYPDESDVSNVYDATGRTIAIIDENGNETGFEYDAAGSRTQIIDASGNISRFTYDANGNQTSMIDANDNITTFVYDVLSRRTETIFADGTKIITAYDALGRTVTETDQAGLSTLFDFDALSRLTKVTNAPGGETRYAYDELGNKITQTDANGHITRWDNDILGRVMSRTLPEGMTESFTYDANGNPLSHTDFNGNTTTFIYDTNNSLVRKTYPDGKSVTFTYTATGPVENVSDARGVTQHTYDSRDRLTRVENPDGDIIDYTYDPVGNRTGVTTPSGTTSYSYDALNRLASVTDPNSEVTTYAYDAVGNRASVTYPNGTQAGYTYDALNRLTRLENLRSDGSVISSYDYTLEPAGNRQREVEENGRTVDYSYDELYRLIGEEITDPVTGSSTIQYTYDAVGNRLTKTVDGSTVVNYAYDTNDRMLSAGSTLYTYDDNGSTLSKIDSSGFTSYGYDFENRLIGAITPVDTIEYAYDADGIRVRSNVNGLESRYLVDKNREFAQVLEERDGLGSLDASYIHGDDLISQSRGNEISYYHYDGLGSARGLTDSSESVTDTYNYQAFGELLSSAGLTVNHYRFRGEQYDANAGLYYLRARYYDPQAGRFVGMDIFPGYVRTPASLHKYSYPHNNPVNAVDPTGLFTLIHGTYEKSGLQQRP